MSSFEIINHSETDINLFTIGTNSWICIFWRTIKFHSYTYKLSLITTIIITYFLYYYYYYYYYYQLS